MAISVSQFLKWVGGRLPFLLALLACIAAIIPLRLPGDLEMTPLYPLMVVFFWGTHRGDLMTPGPIFFTGLFYDLLSGAPPGLWALVFLACHALALVLRDLFGRILYSAWALFAVTCVAAVAMAWLLASRLSSLSCSRITTNSSPPRRATVSPSRTARRNRSAVSTSSLSPS